MASGQRCSGSTDMTDKSDVTDVTDVTEMNVIGKSELL